MKAKHLFSSLVLLVGFLLNISAADYDITNVVLSPASPASLDYGDKVNISFNYEKLSGNVRIWARPFKDGSLADGYAASGSGIYTANSGSGTGDFTFNTEAEVDQIRFQIVQDGTSTVLYEEFVNVDYTFSAYSITGVGLSPSSPATFGWGEDLNISFNYTKASGDVRIWARPFKDGSLADGYAASGSGIYTANSGSGTGYFTFNSDAEVDQVRFQIVEEGTDAVLHEIFVNVDYTWIGYSITNIVLTPVSPATLGWNENVDASFDYTKPDGDVRIFVRPMKDGALAADYAAHPSSLISANAGSGDGYFTFAADALVDQVRIQIVEEGTDAVLHEMFVNVDYTWMGYSITNIVLTPVSPATLGWNENVDASFDYTKPDGDVRIFVRPMKDGALAADYAAHPSSLISANAGSGDGYFTFAADALVDQVRIQIVEEGTDAVLHEMFVNVDYTYQDPTTFVSEFNLHGFSAYPNPFNSNLYIELSSGKDFEYSIYDQIGRKLIEGYSYANKEIVNTSILKNGAYIIILKDEDGNSFKQLIVK